MKNITVLPCKLFRLLENTVSLQTLATLKRRVALCGTSACETQVVCGNLTVRQATSQQVFKVTIFSRTHASSLLHH